MNTKLKTLMLAVSLVGCMCAATSTTAKDAGPSRAPKDGGSAGHDGGSPKAPSWMDPWRHATVAIGQVRPIDVALRDGGAIKKDTFMVVGTGVLVKLPGTDQPYLLTAKHVFSEPSTNWNPESLWLRFYSSEDRPVDEYFGVRVPIRRGPEFVWIGHSDPAMDIALLPLQIPRAEIPPDTQLTSLQLEDFTSPDEIYEPQGVAVLGYPGASGASFWGRALVRTGSVAWVAPHYPDRNPIIIDANLTNGNSGGPVFRLPNGTDRSGAFSVGAKPTFLGIVSQARFEVRPITIGGKMIPGPDGMPLVAEDFIGMSLIVPCGRVRELFGSVAHQ